MKPQLAQSRYPEWTDAFLVPTGWQYVFDELPEKLRLKAKEYYDDFMQSTGGGNP